MKPQLEQLIKQLETDQYAAVRVVDTDTGSLICTNKTGAKMAAESESGSVADWFNDLFGSGVKNIVIQVQRKNGSSFKSMDTFKYSVQPEAQQQPAQQPYYPPQAPAYNPNPGLMGVGDYAGLGAPEATYRMMRYSELLQENKELKEKNARLSKKKRKLEREALENQFADSKANGNKELVSTLMATAPALLGAMKGQTVPIPDTGLASPVPDLGPNQQMLFEAITQMPDHVSGTIFTILKGMNANQEFGEKVLKLIEEHNLQTA